MISNRIAPMSEKRVGEDGGPLDYNDVNIELFEKRMVIKAKLEKPVTSPDNQRSYVRGILSEDGKSIAPLGKGDSSAQDEQTTLSDANAFISVPESLTSLETGAEVTVVVLERRYI